MREFTFRANAFVGLILLLIFPVQAQQGWSPLDKDGIHDPRSPAVKEKMLQEPESALSKLVPDHAGNMVLWMRALESGQINPRASLDPKTEVRVLDQDIFLDLRGSMPIVKFPHRQHTLWLDCANCHEHLFKSKSGENRYSMLAILNGEQCGVCHGAVAFPLTECARCHSVTRDTWGRPTDPRVKLPEFENSPPQGPAAKGGK